MRLSSALRADQRQWLIVFDCDGTLVDSQNAIFSAMQHAFTAEGLTAPSRPEVLSVVGLSLPEAFRVLAPTKPPSVQQALALRYKSAFPHTGLPPVERDPLFPGAKAVVEDFGRREELALGIATGKSQRGVARLIEQEQWHGLFRTIQTADENPSKPHPGMLLAAMSEVEIAPERTVMIGDTSYDIEMGRNAGVATIGVEWGYHDVAELRAAGADIIVDRFDALSDALAELLERVR